MRILILSNIDMGLYKFRRELMQELTKDNEVFFCVPSGGFVKKIEELGCKFIENKFLNRHGTNPIQELRLIVFYKRTIKKLNPDVVLTYTIKPNVYGGMVCANLGIPYLVNITGLGTSIENGGLLQKVGLLLYKQGLRKAKKVFFQNKENRDFMVNRGIVKGEYDILPGSGVNLEQYKVYQYPRGNTVDFIFVARVMKEKGIEQFLDAAKEIRNRHPETRFHIYGFCEQNYAEKLKQMSDDGVIIYHGLVDEMSHAYQMSSCTIHPSYYPEGISNVLLESLASGRPIITTNRSGCREVVEDGINGYLIKDKDSQDLIEKIECFLNLNIAERVEMGRAGRRKVEREFDRKIVVEKYLLELKKIEKENQ